MSTTFLSLCADAHRKSKIAYMNTEELEKTLDRVNDWIVAVDQKTSVAVAVIVGFITLSAKPTVDLILNSWQDMSWLSASLLIVSFALLLLGALKLLFSTSPRIKSKAKSLLYFGSIAGLTLKQYKSASARYKSASYKQDLTEQIHTNSLIAKKKYIHYKDALWVIFLAVFLWLTFVALTITEMLYGKA